MPGSRLAAVVLSLGCIGPVEAAEPAADLYRWSPVRLGAGGCVTGFVTHPIDAAVRYCRTDIGNAYRWDGKEWRPMVVRGPGKGMPAAVAAVPAACGIDSIAVDPSDKVVVYLALAVTRSSDVGATHPAVPGNVYKSTDGGASFAAGSLAVAMEPNGPWRSFGERLKVDPKNPAVVFYGSVKDGLWRSADGGRTWTACRGGGAPAATANVLSVHFGKAKGTVARDGVNCSPTLFAVLPRASVLTSEDGGANWTNVSAGSELDGKCLFSTVDPAGALVVVADGSKDLWRWTGRRWQKTPVEMDWNRTPHAVAFAPTDPTRVVAVAGTSRSADGGKTWTRMGPEMRFANTLGWLPQPKAWRNNGGVVIDRDGVCWMPQGNEGVLRAKVADQDGEAKPLAWTIDSAGIEELVAHDVILPPKGDAVFSVQDATGLVSGDLAKFVARQIPLQDQLISNGTGLAYCPNAPEFLVVATADVHHTKSGKSYSGYSPDGGKSWKHFAGQPANPETKKPLNAAGSIAVSRRGDWTTGGDHLVWLPTGDGPTHYSHDGGKTWAPSTGFPVKNGYWNFALKQRMLAADPHVADTFYFAASWSGGFYASTDGGRSWKLEGNAGLPTYNHHGHLAANPAVPGDLWFCDGWEGASKHGVWHSTDGGKTFARLPGVEYALTLGLGAGRGGKDATPYSVYFYGKLAVSPDWGIFRSTDAGVTWARVAHYPCGLFDQPTCLAASWDEFGKVVVGLSGNGFVVGTAGKK